MGGLSTVDKRLIYYLSGDLGESPTPYADLAARLGLTEDEVLAAIRRFRDQGLIRRFGATLWHQRSGFTANAMVVFRVEADRAGECGEKLARRSYVSHCYLRRPTRDWPFNLYAMIHADSQDRLCSMVEEMAVETGAAEWRMLESLRELKKVSLRYFADQVDSGAEADQSSASVSRELFMKANG